METLKKANSQAVTLTTDTQQAKPTRQQVRPRVSLQLAMISTVPKANRVLTATQKPIAVMVVMAAKLRIATIVMGIRALLLKAQHRRLITPTLLKAIVAMDPIQQLVIRVMNTRALRVTVQVISQFTVVHTLPMMVMLTQQHRLLQATVGRHNLITLKVMKVTKAMCIRVLRLTVKLSAVT